MFAFKDTGSQTQRAIVYHLYRLREPDIFKLVDLDELGALIREGVRNADRRLEGDDNGFNVPMDVLGLELSCGWYFCCCCVLVGCFCC